MPNSAEQKVCNRGALLAHVTRAGVQAGYSENLADWNGEAIALAVEVVKEFEQSLREPRSDRPSAQRLEDFLAQVSI